MNGDRLTHREMDALLSHLWRGGSVLGFARSQGRNSSSTYYDRRKGDSDFAEAWDAAVSSADDRRIAERTGSAELLRRADRAVELVSRDEAAPDLALAFVVWGPIKEPE